MSALLSHKDTQLSFVEATVSIGEATPLSRLSLTLAKGTPTALLGSNGSGKSTLLKALVGDPQVRLQAGRLLLEQTGMPVDWGGFSPHERALHGLFMAWQHPPALLGLKQRVFLRTVLNAHRQAKQQETLDPFDFLDVIRPCLARVGLPESWLERGVGEGFSGGERKKNELLQMLLLQPSWILCDEIEAGMDVDTLRLTASLLSEHVAQGRGLVVVSHHAHFLDLLPIQRSVRLQGGSVSSDVCGGDAPLQWRN